MAPMFQQYYYNVGLFFLCGRHFDKRKWLIFELSRLILAAVIGIFLAFCPSSDHQLFFVAY